MKLLAPRIIGLIIILGAVGGLILAIVGLIAVQRAKRQLTAEVMSGLDLLSQTLDATGDGLAVADESLQTAQDTLQSVETAVGGIGATIEDTTPVIDAIGDMMGNELPQAVRATRTSLASAATSARAVDDALATMSAVPFLGLSQYQPATPLHESLSEVSDSLADLPESLSTAEAGLNQTSANLARVGADVTGVAGQIGQMDTSLRDAGQVVKQYQVVVSELQTGVADLRAELPRAITLAARVISLALVWLAISQIGLLWQGATLMRGAGGERQPALPEPTTSELSTASE